MNLVHLRSFYFTVKHKSISKAAKELHLTQPGLSMQLQNLENTLGVCLLKRSRKGVELTEYGQIVYDHTETMLSLEENIQQAIENYEKKNTQLVLGSCKSMGDYALPCTLYTFKQIYSDIDILMDVDSTFSIIKKIQEMSINIGIIQHSSVPNDLECESLLSDELVLIASPDYEKDKISINDIYDIPIIMREKGSATRSNLENILTRNGIDINKLNIIYSFSSPEAIKQSIMSGKGLSFMPNVTLRHELRNGSIKRVNVTGLDTTFNYYLAYRKNHTFTGSEKIFFDFMMSKSRCFCY